MSRTHAPAIEKFRPDSTQILRPQQQKTARIRKHAGGWKVAYCNRLKDQLPSKLECAGIESRRNLPRLSTIETSVEAAVLSGASKLGMVPGIEGVYAELEC